MSVAVDMQYTHVLKNGPKYEINNYGQNWYRNQEGGGVSVRAFERCGLTSASPSCETPLFSGELHSMTLTPHH